MAEPLGRGLRAAPGSGLTSPEPVSTPTAPAATQNPVPDPGTQDKPHSRRAAGRPRPDQLAKLLVQESSRKRATGIGRWIEAKDAAAEARFTRQVRDSLGSNPSVVIWALMQSAVALDVRVLRGES
jgi:hypothetical protein